MQWPADIDYSNALQNPATAFSDPMLKQGSVETNAMGLPKARSGNGAIVFKVTAGGRHWAVRCFKREFSERRDRYTAVDRYLSGLSIAQLSGFSFIERGICVAGLWYPILRMEWVAGDLLLPWVERHLDKPEALRAFAARFVQAASVLRRSNIGHGDLQHGNIVVANGDVRFIDYDSMFVPELAGRSSPELGHPNFQHPKRAEHHFGAWIDDFSTWLIYVSLVALSFDPGLWKRYAAGQEALLFKRADLTAPERSPVFAELARTPDARLRVLAQSLRGLLNLPPDALPALGDGAAVPPGQIVIPCPACRSQLTVAAQTGPSFIRCPGCRHEQEWGPAVPSPRVAAAGAAHEWWREGAAVPSAAPSQPSPRILVEASLWKPASAGDLSWIVDSLTAAPKPSPSHRRSTFVAEHVLMAFTALGLASLCYGLAASPPTRDEWQDAILAVAVYVLPNPVIWVIRYRRHPARRAYVEHRRQLDALTRQERDVERRRRESARKQIDRQAELDQKAAALGAARASAVKRKAEAVRKACAPIEQEALRAKAKLDGLDAELAQVLALDLGPLDQRLASLQRALVVVASETRAQLQSADSDERVETAKALQRSQADLAEPKRQLAAIQQQESMAIVGATQEFLRRALDAELPKHSIRSANIPGLGPVLRQRLEDAGIKTAADVKPSVLAGIEGFGGARVAAVVRWQSQIFARIQNRHGRLPEAEERRIRERWFAQRSSLSTHVSAGEAQLEQELGRIRVRAEGRRAAIRASCVDRETELRREVASIESERAIKERAIRAEYSSRSGELLNQLAAHQRGTALLRRQVEESCAAEELRLDAEARNLQADAKAAGTAIEAELSSLQATEWSLTWRKARLLAEAQSQGAMSFGQYVRGVLG